MFPSPIKWFNHLTSSTYAWRASEPLRLGQGRVARFERKPSETPLFDATVLATGVNPEPYEMDHVDQAFHSAHVTGPMVHILSRLALPLYTTAGDAA